MLDPKLTEVDDCVEMQPVTDPLSFGPESEGPSSLSSQQEMEDAPTVAIETDGGRVKKGKKKYLSFEYCLQQMTLECEWYMCSAKFKKMEIFCSHINDHITSDFRTATADGYICIWRDCENACDTKEELNRHIHFHAFHTKLKAIGTVLSKAYNEVVCTLDSNGRNMIPEIPDDFQCMWDSCSCRFASAQEFYWHVQRHVYNLYPNENNQYICNWQGCKWKFKVHLRLSDHMRSHTQEKRVGCPNCGMIYSTNTKFFDHYMRQVPVKFQPHQCSHCSIRFPTVRLLRDHVRRHINHFKCAECDMTCPTRSVLVSHMKYKHNNARPYKCPQCDKSFKSSVDLSRHMTVHSDEPAFVCPLATCEYSCRAQSTLNKHIKLLHNSMTKYHYLCHICESKFSTGFFLTKHLKKVHHFHWPSGHSRFRYKQDPDGFYRLQTIRYESMVLTNEGDENLQEDEEEMVDDPLALASPHHDDKVAEDFIQSGLDAKTDSREKSLILSPPSMPRLAKNQQIILPSEY